MASQEEKYPSPAESEVVKKAEELMIDVMSRYDPSHDVYHVERVRRTALNIAKEIRNMDPNITIDLFVVELAALLHDILDRKYLKEPVEDPIAFFRPFFNSVSMHVDLLNDGRADLIVKVIDNVSWTNEKRLRAMHGGKGWTEWHETCMELHCVQDADRLDAIGGIGILRCAAFSAATSRPLITPADDPAHPGSCLQHFHEKLLFIRDRLKTLPGKRMGDARHQTMLQFLSAIEAESKSYA